jgi:RNA recognition motif-containing protein
MNSDDVTTTVVPQHGTSTTSPQAFRVEGAESLLATAMSDLTLLGDTQEREPTGGNDPHQQHHHLSVNFGDTPYHFSTAAFVPNSSSPSSTTPDAPIIYPELPPAREFSEVNPSRKYSESSPSKRSSELSKNFAELPPSRNTSSNRGRRSGTPKLNADGTELTPPCNAPPVTQHNANDSSARNLYVSSLPNQFSTQQLYQMFAPFGTVLSARFMPPKGAAPPTEALPPTNTSGEPLPPDSTNFRGFGFVCYEKEEDANRAMLSMIGTVIGGSKIQVRPSRRHSDGGHIATPQAPARNTSTLSQRSGGGSMHQSQSSMGGSSSVHPQMQQMLMAQQQQQQSMLSGSGGPTFMMNTVPTGPQAQYIQVSSGAVNYVSAAPMQAPMGQYVVQNGGGAFYAPSQQLGYTTTLGGSGSLQASGPGQPTMVAAGPHVQYWSGTSQWMPQQMTMQTMQQQPGSLGGSGGATDFGGSAFYSTSVAPQGVPQPTYGQAQGGNMFVVMPPPYQM